MAEFQLKDAYSPEFFEKLSQIWSELDSSFNSTDFIKQIYAGDWEELELKNRMHRISECMHDHLPDRFKKACDFIHELLQKLKIKGFKVSSYEFLFFPDYIEKFGQNDLKVSLDTIYQITQLVSCEFAIRPFLKKHEKTVLSHLHKWSKDSNLNVRRLSSEGCRPRLPWSFQLKSFVTDPSPILKILENLKADESLFVRKSVANNLNDISKDHPDVVLSLCEKWKKENNSYTQWIIKHACRSLLKSGNKRALTLFGYADNRELEIGKFEISPTNPSLGSSIDFHFRIKNKSSGQKLIRMEYALYFLKSRGQKHIKVFKIGEKNLCAYESVTIKKKHLFRDLSTRKHYRGEHNISLVINGKEIEKIKFILD